MQTRVYMDYNATAPLLQGARDAMLLSMEELGNPSSVHKEGQQARRIINTARDQLANLCSAEAAHITFTSGATEAATHLLTPRYKMGRSGLNISKLYVSAVEHPCLLTGGRFSAEDVVVIGVDAHGRINLDELETQLSGHDQSQGLPMLALQAANNETGVLQPIRDAVACARSHNALVVIDAVQLLGKKPISIAEMDADFLIVSSHKIGGPKGVGAIISKGEILMPSPLIVGGGHEKGHRAGTENLIGISGFGAACEVALKNLHVFLDIGNKRDQLEQKMQNLASDLVIHGKGVERIDNTTCFTLPGMKSETMQIAFDMEGIAASSGSACSSGKVSESHVLVAMNADAHSGALRVSMGPKTSDEDVERFLQVFEKMNERRLSRQSEKLASV